MEKNLEVINYQNKTLYLIKTAHVSKNSVEDVKRIIDEIKPDAICIELDKERKETLLNKEGWRNTDITKVIKEHKVGFLLVNVILSSFQKRMAAKMDTQSGGEMLEGIKKAEELKVPLILADRNIKTTFKRIWNSLGLKEKMKLLMAIVMAIFDDEDINEEELARLKEADSLDVALAEVGKDLPTVKRILVDERDMYLAAKIKSAPGEKIVAIIGAAHAKGIKNHLNEDIDLKKLDDISKKKSLLGEIIKWSIPALLIFIVIYTLFINLDTGLNQIKNWILLTGSLSALGALIAFSHPLTILVAFFAAPITTIHPLLASGWFAGLAEAYLKKPRVKDFEDLSLDTDSFKGFYKNRVTHILLVVILTNVFSSLGTIIGSIDIIRSFLGIL